MSDYKLGVWYGWTGGECPVHPETEVTVILRDDPTDPGGSLSAGNLRWSNSEHDSDIIAFRVVSHYVEPRKPREYWVAEYPGGLGYLCKSHAEAKANAKFCLIRIVHLREVMDE